MRPTSGEQKEMVLIRWGSQYKLPLRCSIACWRQGLCSDMPRSNRCWSGRGCIEISVPTRI